MSFSPQSQLRPAPNAVAREVEGEILVVDVRSGNYYVLDEVSAFLWKRIESSPANAEEMMASLLEEYDTSAEECHENILNFCRYVVSEQLATQA